MLLLFFLGIGLIFACVGALFGLWISALVSVLKNPVVKQENKIPWFLVVFFVNPIGPIIFFFMHGFKKRAWWTLILTIVPIILWFVAIGGALSFGLNNADKYGVKIENSATINYLETARAEFDTSDAENLTTDSEKSFMVEDGNASAVIAGETLALRDFVRSKIFFALVGLGAVSIAGILALWITGLVKVLTDKKIIDSGTKILWFLLIFFVNPIGAIVYFFKFGYKKLAWTTLAFAVLPIIVLILYAVTAVFMAI
ncbi:PLDc N-terminal domain-containing protein [Candidatus Peregrinibacteria bacterium]|nr:PLDc N-terminal domain-containing protein [Candidatus Peregrinibacteria bacterium]